MKDYDKQVQGSGEKTVLIIGCVHGDELIGKKVINALRKFSISNGTMVTVIANMRAVEAKKRFIDQDLNRSFPGNPKGNHEERLAYSLFPLIKEADIVLDIHSTTTDTTSTIILTKVNQHIRQLLSSFCPKQVVVMEKKVGKTALTGYCKAGISFEYGKDDSEEAFKDILADIIKILKNLKMVGVEDSKPITPHKTKYFQVLGSLPRPTGFKLEGTIKNFSLIRRGEVVARKGMSVQKAPRNFYPFLFGEKAYKEIWGFIAKKVTSI